MKKALYQMSRPLALRLHKHTNWFNGNLLSEPGLAGCPHLHFPKTVHPPRTTKCFHILPDTIPLWLPRTARWFSSFHYHLCVTFNPVSIVLTFHMSKPSQSTVLITALTGSNPNSSSSFLLT